MNKKYLIIFICLVIIIAGLIYYYNLPYAEITLDINPSIKINLDKNNKIKKVIALNEDAKKIIDKKLNGKTIKEGLKTITINIIENDFTKENHVEILLYTDGKIDKDEIVTEIKNNFGEKDISTDVIIIDSINKEDKKLAKKYNISLAKAAYINMVTNEHQDLPIESLVDSSISELTNTKNTGYYCDVGYILDGSRCTKKIGEKPAEMGKVCPEGYDDDNGKCYARADFYEGENYICHEEYTLENGECVKKTTIPAIGDYSCPKGKLIKRGEAYREYRDAGDYEEMTCADESTAQKPKQRCLQQEHIIVNGKCGMGPKPLLPTPSGCTPEDTNINGGCYDFNNNDWVCPTSGIYETEDMLCPETITYTKAIVNGYSCEEGYTLNGDKCTKTEKEEPSKERLCPGGYKLVNWDRCLNYSKETEHVDGYVCKYEDSYPENDKCILQEVMEAKKS